MANGQCQSTDTSRGKESDREAEDILTSLLSFELYTLNTWRAIWLLSAFDMRSSRLHYSGNNSIVRGLSSQAMTGFDFKDSCLVLLRRTRSFRLLGRKGSKADPISTKMFARRISNDVCVSHFAPRGSEMATPLLQSDFLWHSFCCCTFGEITHGYG